MRHLINLLNLNQDEFFQILKRGREHAANRRLNPDVLRDKVIALIFEKSSTRTRISFSVAIRELGGSDLELQAGSLQLGRGETIEDTTRVLGRYVHAVMIRTDSHRKLELMAGLDELPIINGLSDRHHPCQALADCMTILETGRDLSKTRIAFIGEPNNVFNSLALASLHSGSSLCVACPEGYEIRPGIQELLRKRNKAVDVFRDPAQAVRNADVIYTDVWISMGQEGESEIRKKDFAGYSVSEALMKHAPSDAIVMHCLPAHRGEEITDEVMDRHAATIFRQAENRLHVQKAVLEWIFGAL
jgi:ornithine carbamoyltransferase